MTDPQPTLHTDRLILRPFELADAPAVQRLAGDRAVADTTGSIPHPYPDGAAEAWISTHAAKYATGRQAMFAITVRGEHAAIGSIGLVIQPDHASAELGYWLGVPFWGRGYATEASRAVVEFGFRQLMLHRIHAHHVVRNPASGRVMQKLGMRLEGTHRDAIRKWGVFEDVACYAVLETEWRVP